MTEPKFFILRRGSKESGGPYTQEQIVEMLNLNEIVKTDYVFYEGAEDWQTLEATFDFDEEFNYFVDEGQDQNLIDQLFAEASNLLKPSEKIYYIALQAQDEILTRARQSLVISSQHLYHLTHKDAGYEIEAHLWQSIIDIDYSTAPNDLTTVAISIAITINKGRKVEVPYIPELQAKRLVELSKEMRKQ